MPHHDAEVAAAFRKHGYCHIKGLIDARTCVLATQYVQFAMGRYFSPEGDDEQVPGAHASYADPLMETFLSVCRPVMERLTGLSLFPTYSYYRVYRPGDALPRHFDRPSCEVSVTICLGCRINGSQLENLWPLFVGSEKGVAGTPGKPIYCAPGEAVIYRGCEMEHWREPLQAEKNSFQVQAFLHYVNAAGPFGQACRFDGRPAIGLPANTRDRERSAEADRLVLPKRENHESHENGVHAVAH